MDGREWWTVPANVVAGVLRRLAGALIGAAMLVTIVGVVGPTWGGAAALAWSSTGVLMLTKAGERLTARTLLRYRPAAGTWLAGEVARLAPGCRIDVYVAPHALGVFAVGGYTVAIGQRSVGTAGQSSAVQVATVSAVADLRAGRTRAELAMMWWSAPWVLAKMTLSHLLPARWHPVLRVVGCALMGMSLLTCLRHGQPVGAAIGACMLADLALAHTNRGRLRDTVGVRAATEPLRDSLGTPTR